MILIFILLALSIKAYSKLFGSREWMNIYLSSIRSVSSPISIETSLPLLRVESMASIFALCDNSDAKSDREAS